MYRVPVAEYRYEEVIKRSKFITTIAHTPTEEDAKLFIARIKEEFSDASHNCWGYIAGIPGNTAKIGMSDDGEPHGTAGKPILNILLHSGIIEISAVVTRYFGGIKLGTGGLVRAYSGSVKNALDKIATMEKRETVRVEIVTTYAQGDIVKKIAESFDAAIINVSYGARVFIELELAKESKDTFLEAVHNATRGEIIVKERGIGDMSGQNNC